MEWDASGENDDESRNRTNVKTFNTYQRMVQVGKMSVAMHVVNVMLKMRYIL